MKPLDLETFPLDGHRIIEASAGTGKTYTITNLYLRLLLGDGHHPRPFKVDEILVLTFTVAATEELRRRIRERVAEARHALLRGESPDPLLNLLAQRHRDDGSRLLTAALQLMDEASIFTIHGFCARVLKEQSFETGMLFNQELTADRDAVLQQAVEDCFRVEILALPGQQRDFALSLWPDPASLEQAIKGFLFRPNLTLVPPVQDLSGLERSLEERITTVKKMWQEDDIPGLLRAAGIHGGRRTITWIPEMTAFCESDKTSFDYWREWTTAIIRRNLNKGREMPAHVVFEIIDSIETDQEQYRQQLVGNLWHRAIDFVRRRVDRIIKDLGELTLDDLLIRVEEALAQPESGPDLGRRLAARWPIAMVDEFQDTDDIQYQIFSHIYRQPGEQTLILIGDPKQAIYQFRGADIYTYINAKRQIDIDEDLYSLDTNWRSTAPLIDAINRLFDQRDIFLNDRDIPYTPAQPTEASASRFCIQGEDVIPTTLLHVHGEQDKLKKEDARVLAMEHAAEEVSRLLNLGARGDAVIDDEPLGAGQIAFLVRDRHDAREARAALRRRGIRSVYVTLESVFLSDTADDLKLILEAVLDPANERALRAALATPLLQCTAVEIDSLNHNVMDQQRVLEEFLDYHQRWANHDIAPMIESLISRRRIAEKWLGHPDGERQLTNLRHLAELLQKRSDVAPGMHRLLSWFIRERADAETVSIEERQLRLESDQHLVQIVTMHAAKGLQYDVVMIPMAGFKSWQRTNEPALFHETADNGYSTIVDLNPGEESRRQAQEEKMAEDLRLLYVAITRARYKCYIGIPNTPDILDTAAARLVGLRETDGTRKSVAQHLQGMFGPPLFQVQSIGSEASTTPFDPTPKKRRLIAPDPPPRINDSWRLHSYTGLTRLVPEEKTEPGFAAIAGYGDDEPVTEPRRGGPSRFSFPRGPRVGIALHELLERISFQPTETELINACERTLNRIGIDDDRERWLEVLHDWVTDILGTPVAEGIPFTLAQIDDSHRIAEMEFHFSIRRTAHITALLRKFEYLQGLAGSLDNLDGVVTGLIDLIVQHEGQFYLIDYKSNYLGPQQKDYEAPQLSLAIATHHYDLQYLLYCVALHRYLGNKLPNYDYGRHFGGVLYLFLRGMDTNPGNGVFFDKPSPDLVTQLDKLLEGQS